MFTQFCGNPAETDSSEQPRSHRNNNCVERPELGSELNWLHSRKNKLTKETVIVFTNWTGKTDLRRYFRRGVLDFMTSERTVGIFSRLVEISGNFILTD